MKERLRIVELKLFLILIPVINVFNYYLTYNDIQFSWRTAASFAIDTIQGYAALIAVHLIIIYLDKKLPFDGNLLKRLILQVTSTLFAGMAIIIGSTILIHILVRGGPFPTSFFQYDVVIISIWFLVINGVYVSIHFYRQWKTSQQVTIEQNKIKTGGLRVKSGKQEIILSFEQIAGFSVDGEYIMCFTLTGKKFILDYSMEKLEKLLPDVWFFRLNRQFLLHRQMIAGFEKTKNGKLNVMVNSPAFASPINVSRSRAVDFKRWFDPA
jgi:hypothetical protein